MKSFMGLFVLLLVLVGSGDAVSYTSINLDNYCDQTKIISCPYYSGESGTATYSKVWSTTGRCNTTFILDTYCGSSSDTFAIYFNIKKSVLPTLSNITIYENGAIVKRIPGGTTTQSYSPTSAGQLLSSYSRRPSFTLVFVEGTSVISYPSVVIDYTIVYKNYGAYTSYCTALGGYVHDNYICDGSQTTDRVNCPSSYTAVTAMNNRVSTRQCSSYTGVPTTPYWSYPTRYPSYDYDYDSLSGGAVAGIIIGTLIGVTVFGIIISVACRKFNMNNRTTRVQHAMVANRNTAPIVAGGYHPQQAGGTTVHFQTNAGATSYQPPVFAGAPPSYAAVAAGSAPYPVQGQGGPAPYPAGQVSFSVGESGALPYPAAQGGPMPYPAGEAPKL